MDLKAIREQLIANNEEQIATTDSVDALTKVLVERFKIEDRSKLDQLEALKEGGKKSGGAAAPAASKAPDDKGFDWTDLLNRFALPGLVALGASLTGFDAAIRALKIPDYLSTIRTAFNSISDTFSRWSTRATNFVDRIKKFELPKLPDFPELKITWPERWTQLGTRIADAVRDVLPSLDDIKAKLPKVLLPETWTSFADNLKTRVSNLIPTMDDIKAKLPKIEMPEASTTFYDNVKTRISNLFPSLDDMKAKLPKIELPKFELLGADGKPWKFPDFSGFVPDALKNLEMPSLDGIKSFFVGAEEGGGLIGFLGKLKDMILKIPGIKTAFRLVGGPVTQAIIGLIDFFTGFYKGFVGEEQLDEAGNVIEDTRGMKQKLLDGLEGGLDGFLKGIVDGVQLLFLDIPKWILSKLGVDMSWMDNFDLWDDIVSPVWEVIKSVPKFIFSAEYRKEQLDKVKTAWDEAGGLKGIAMDIFDAIKDAVTSALEKLPTPRELYDKLIAKLPKWMRPDTDQEKIDALETKGGVSREEVLATNGNMEQLKALAERADDNSYTYGYNQAMEAMQAILDDTPEAARGGYTLPKMPGLGSLVRVHPNELIVPLDKSEEGQGLSQLSKVLNSTAADLQNAQRESGQLAASASTGTIVNNIVDNSTKSSSNVSNASNYSAPVSPVDRAMPVMLY